MLAIGRADLAGDARLVSNEGRSKHIDEIDEAITAWTRTKQPAEALKVLGEADVPSGPIYSAEEMLADAHFKARGVFEEADLGGGDSVKLPGWHLCWTRLRRNALDWTALGEHNTEVYRDWLGYPPRVGRLSKNGRNLRSLLKNTDRSLCYLARTPDRSRRDLIARRRVGNGA